jgi:H+-transporting ATPase
MIDTMVLSITDLQSLSTIEQTDFMPFDPVVKRTEGTIRDKNTNDVYKVTKGAPHILMGLTNNDTIRNKIETDVAAFGLRGIRCLAVAKTNDDNNWEVLGLLTFLDPPRFDTKETIHRAMSYGVEVKMITGDHLLIGMILFFNTSIFFF